MTKKDELLSIFNEGSSLATSDQFFLHTANGQCITLTAEAVRAYLRRNLVSTFSIDKDGYVIIDGKRTEYRMEPQDLSDLKTRIEAAEENGRLVSAQLSTISTQVSQSIDEALSAAESSAEAAELALRSATAAEQTALSAQQAAEASADSVNEVREALDNLQVDDSALALAAQVQKHTIAISEHSALFSHITDRLDSVQPILIIYEDEWQSLESSPALMAQFCAKYPGYSIEVVEGQRPTDVPDNPDIPSNPHTPASLSDGILTLQASLSDGILTAPASLHGGAVLL